MQDLTLRQVEVVRRIHQRWPVRCIDFNILRIGKIRRSAISSDQDYLWHLRSGTLASALSLVLLLAMFFIFLSPTPIWANRRARKAKSHVGGGGI